MSLAILTTALANAASIDIGYQLVESPPVYQKEGNIIISSQHVRSLLYDPQTQFLDNSIGTNRKGIIIDYFPANNSHTDIKTNLSCTIRPFTYPFTTSNPERFD